jgi:hypothetical protein
VLDSPEMRAKGVTVQMQAHWAHVNTPVLAERRVGSSPSTCRSYLYCEVRRATDGLGSTPSRNAEFRRTLVENAVLRATQSPYGVRPLGGTRRGRRDARGVLVRRLGCYGETAAWYDAPSQLSAVTHAPRPQFCEYGPRSRC